MSWIAQAVLGALWAVAGVVIGLSPPLSETGRGSSSPVMGWVFAAFGVYVLIAGFRRSADPPTDRSRRPKHASGHAPDRRTAIGMPVASAMCGLSGFGGIWWGMSSGNVALTWMAVIMASLFFAGFPMYVDALRNRLRRR